MKNKIKFSENDAIQTGQIVNQTRAGSSFDLYSKTEQKERNKAFKIIKGKVKIYKSNTEMKLVNSDWLNDRTELDIVFRRMSLFLILTLLCFVIISLLLFIKNNNF